jgi:hypothetical protein
MALEITSDDLSTTMTLRTVSVKRCLARGLDSGADDAIRDGSKISGNVVGSDLTVDGAREGFSVRRTYVIGSCRRNANLVKAHHLAQDRVQEVVYRMVKGCLELG